MIAFLLRLYPSAWQRRYGDEFAAMLEERPLGPFDVADVLLGALDAHLHRLGRETELDHRKGLSMTLRIGGTAAIAFGALWATAIGLASLSQSDDDTIAFVLSMIADVCLIVALVGLSAFQARQHPRLVWGSVILPIVGGALTILGTVGMAMTGDEPFLGGVSAWYVWVFGVAGILIGSILFAYATWNTGALARRAAGAVGVGAAWTFLWMFLTPYLMVIGLSLFSAGWIWLGVDALRRDRPAVAAI